ncbi:MAG: hypothetical protein HYZ53_13345 [Planctomycetes bacterium]|nr:hypothetical protein [Planctomycetota bacterium]
MVTDFRGAVLRHPDLADDLRPLIAEPSKNWVCRRAAMGIAAACGEAALAGDLLAVALSKTERGERRSEALRALIKVCPKNLLPQIRPLAALGPDEDPKDALKGQALRALWPDILSTVELFQQLRAPANPRVLGDYHRFLCYEIPARLATSELDLALTWVRGLGRRHHMPDAFRSLMGGLLVRAWKEMATPAVFEALAATIWRLVVEHSLPGFGSGDRLDAPFGEGADSRHALLVTLLSHAGAASEKRPHHLGILRNCAPPLLHAEDMPWLISLLDQATDPVKRVGIARMIRGCHAWDCPDHLPAIAQAARAHSALPWWFKPLRAQRRRDHRSEGLLESRCGYRNGTPTPQPILAGQRVSSWSLPGRLDAVSGMAWLGSPTRRGEADARKVATGRESSLRHASSQALLQRKGAARARGRLHH